MKTKFALFFIFFMLSTTSFAQLGNFLQYSDYNYFEQISKKDSIDDVCLRVQYHVTYKFAKEDNSMSEDMQALDIGNKMSKYYSNDIVYCYEHLPVEMREKKDLTEALETAIKQCDKYKNNIGMIYRNYPEPQKIAYYKTIELEGILSSNPEAYFYTEDIPHPEWTLEEGDTTICNYACQKATTTFRGRTWHVWYAIDLPYEEGPWKLGGLPGIILKADDTTGEYQFNAIEIYQPKDRCIKSPNKEIKYQKSSEKKIQSSLTAIYKNPAGYVQMTEGDFMVGIFEDMGINMKASPRTPCFLEYTE